MKTKSSAKLKVVLIVLFLLIAFFAVAIVMLFLDANHVLSKSATKTAVKNEINIIEDTNEDEGIAMDAYVVEREATEDENLVFADIPEEARKRDYMLAESNTRLLTEEDLADMGKSELMIARNEMYARYGYIFADADLTTYFSEKAWYEPTVATDAFSEEQFNEFETANTSFITNYEKEKGYN